MLRNTPLINAQVDMHAHNYCTEECMCMYNYNEHPRIGTHLGPKLHFLIGITTFCSQLCIIVVASWLKVICFLNQGLDMICLFQLCPHITGTGWNCIALGPNSV